ncbi:MAG: Na(+)-translocating NADH-quinone reductase subunit A [Bacteroidales bacterium]
MIDYIKLSKGLDIPINGKAETFLKKDVISEIIAVKPTDFKGIFPRLEVREGDIVKAGSPIFHDKTRPEIKFTSPISGTVEKIIRGEKRKLLNIIIKDNGKKEYINYKLPKPAEVTKEQALETLLSSGLWAGIKQRPYGIIPNPKETPKDIFISGFSTAPLGPDLDYSLREDFENIQTAVNILKLFTTGDIHLGLNAKTHASTPFHKLKGVEFHIFDGPHPIGNVGIQIHHISPINKGDIVWTVDMHILAVIGKLFDKKHLDMTRIIAITGPCVDKPSYIRCTYGMHMAAITDHIISDGEKMHKETDIRVISGDILTGDNVGKDGYLGFFHNQITILSEGNYHELFGWGKIIRPKKFSFSHSYFSWINPKKKYNMDTNINGGPRAFVMSKVYKDVLPMDILPVYLFKAILAKDVDKMEQLGIYEVIEEDIALCEYVCPSKIEIQNIISDGIDIMIKEML